MKKVLLSLLALCAVPVVAISAECPNCEMGIYDTTDMNQNWGVFDAVSKDVYLGVKFDAAVAVGLRGVEFSVHGMSSFIVQFTPEAGANLTQGSIPAPDDLTDHPPAVFGMNVAWPTCQIAVNGNFVFGKVTLIALGGPGSAGEDIVLTVHRRFPATNPNDSYALFSKCNAPLFTATSTVAGCYVINPTLPPGGTVGGCQLSGTAVEDKGWSSMKALYN